MLWKDADASSEVSVETKDGGVSELIVSNGGGLGTIPTEIGNDGQETFPVPN